MANYKDNYRNSRGSYTPQKSNNNKSSGSGFLKTLGVVLLVFLVVGLIGSIFSRPAGSDEPDTTKPSATESPTEVPEGLISFEVEGQTYSCPAGMTWEEFAGSEYDVNDTFTVRDGLTYFYMMTYEVNVKYSAQNVSASDAIIADAVYTGV